MLFVDLDRFKTINDGFGHGIGDMLLVQVTQRLRARLREEDTLARLGGDEFVVLAENAEQRHAIDQLAGKLRDAFAEPFLLEREEIYVSATIGIAIYPQDGHDVASLLKSADQAMYRAKEVSRGTVQHFARPQRTQARDRLAMDRDLRRALERQEFELWYQPQLELRSQRIVGVEALLRWRAPGRGLLPPGAFIGHAEDSGLILAIDEWVLAAACAQARRWQLEGLAQARISVNMSARQFMRRDIGRVVETALQQSQVAPQHLGIEITESAFVVRPRPRPGEHGGAAHDRALARDRRLRHRLLLAELPARVSGRRAEDRPLVHPGRRRGAWRGDRQGGDRARPRAAVAGARRGGRDARPAQGDAPVRLRRAAGGGVLGRPAGRRDRGDAARERRRARRAGGRCEARRRHGLIGTGPACAGRALCAISNLATGRGEDRMASGARYLFIVSMDVAPDKEALFNQVYDLEHVPNLLAVPGVLKVTRAKSEAFALTIGGERKEMPAASPRYTAIYELESAAVLASEAWAQGGRGGALAGRGAALHDQPSPRAGQGDLTPGPAE